MNGLLMNDPEFLAQLRQQMQEAPPVPQPDIPVPTVEQVDEPWSPDYKAMASAAAQMGQMPQIQHNLHRGGGMVGGQMSPMPSGAGMNSASLMSALSDSDRADKKDKLSGLDKFKGLLAMFGG
jgi:hypothetical protein